MRAFQIAGKLDGKVLEIQTPEPKSDEVRLKIAYVGICGSDLHYYFDGANGAFVVKEPLIPGHEISGTVDLDPSGTYSEGTKVTIHPATFGNCEPGLEDKPHLWPGGGYLGSASTYPHTQGAMSEYFIVKRENVRILPDSLDLKVASLSEPLGVALHAINIAGGVINKEVLVSGSGPIGLMVIAAAKVLGAKLITATDVLPNALERAKVLGANSLINVSNQEVPQNSFDLVFECSAAAPAITSALLSVKRAGTVIQLGMMGAQGQSVGLAPLVAKEVTWRGSFRFNGEVDQAIEMLSANNWIGNAISHTFDLDNSVEAFEIAKDSSKSGKVLVQVQ